MLNWRRARRSNDRTFYLAASPLWRDDLSLIGIVLAGYLTYAHVNTNALVCGLGDCQSVQASEFATIGPVPVALLGLGMYASPSSAPSLSGGVQHE